MERTGANSVSTKRSQTGKNSQVKEQNMKKKSHDEIKHNSMQIAVGLVLVWCLVIFYGDYSVNLKVKNTLLHRMSRRFCMKQIKGFIKVKL